MRAQVSIEFLFNFLAMLALLSILIVVLSHFLSAAKFHEQKLMEKTEMEEFARMLDLAETMKREKFYNVYPISDVSAEGVIVGTETQVRSYTIYGFGDNYAEPI